MVARASTHIAKDYLAEEAHDSKTPAYTLFPSSVPCPRICIHLLKGCHFPPTKEHFSHSKRGSFSNSDKSLPGSLTGWGKLKLVSAMGEGNKKQIDLLAWVFVVVVDYWRKHVTLNIEMKD